MSEVLSGPQRTALDGAVQRGRAVAEAAAADELRRLAVADRARPGYLSEDENGLRLALREKARQLGDDTRADDADLTLLTADVAYEQWHRLLFARFLEVNGLLLHPAHGVPVTMAQCEDLAAEEGEPDGWSVAAAFAAAILPGVFRLNDPSVRVRFSPERRAQLEAAVAGIDRATFASEDGLGWVYQFWQTAQKKLVNESGRKIGGADLSPVTQLFTENYMVRFLLENSLGAWWAARHPDSPLVATWDYLRTLEDGTPAAGTFDEWPATAAEVTVMDPCCGSGHFLVAAFGMLWRMRAEEEGLDAAEAQDVVLRGNLFGLELDPRCTQIAMFNVVLEAWKQGGYRPLPTPQVACSGIPVRASRAEWEALAGDDGELRAAMGRLHTLFRNADTLGSLIDPRPRGGDGALLGSDLRMVDTWERTSELLGAALVDEGLVETVTGEAALGVAHAAHLLGRLYTLVTTNPPYLQRSAMSASLLDHVEARHPLAKADLATAFLERSLDFTPRGSIAVVSPQNWYLLKNYTSFRKSLLDEQRIDAAVRLGSGAFRQISGEVVKVGLTIITRRRASAGHRLLGLAAHREPGFEVKARVLRNGPLLRPIQVSQRANPDSRLTLASIGSGTLLAAHAEGLAGICSGDYPRFGRYFWERTLPHADWSLQQSTTPSTRPFGGRDHIFWWEGGSGRFHRFVAERLGEWGVGAWIRGDRLGGRRGVAVSQMGDLPVTLYTG
ncbi:MAG TPA: N-6 DNA methylase, partial [Propionicimonas sp.]|nr:N-6 DNA methylase [Propionicimonas sp.]